MKKYSKTLYRKKYGKSSSEEIREIGIIQFTCAAGRGKRKRNTDKKGCNDLFSV
jgi:hypothetical protein